jgi:hypothetical protein
LNFLSSHCPATALDYSYSEVHSLTVVLICGAKCLRTDRSKGYTRVGASLPEDGSRGGLRNVTRILKLDGEQSSETENRVTDSYVQSFVWGSITGFVTARSFVFVIAKS